VYPSHVAANVIAMTKHHQRQEEKEEETHQPPSWRRRPMLVEQVGKVCWWCWLRWQSVNQRNDSLKASDTRVR
jgi:hypothetical protein